MRPPSTLKHIKAVRSAGRVYLYFDTGVTVNGKRIFNRLPSMNDPGFGAAYAAMLGARTKRANLADVHTVASLVKLYQRSNKFTALSRGTQHTYNIYLKRIVDLVGSAPADDFTRKDVYQLMDVMSETPIAANMAVVMISNVYRYAIAREAITCPNPAADIDKNAGGEHQPWPEDLLAEALSDPEVREIVGLLMASPFPWALENPVSIISSRIRKPDQTFHPYMFGHGEVKRTCLWLSGLPKLKPTNIVEGRHPRVHLMPPGPDRARLRSETYSGVADAMAAQWGDYLMSQRRAAA